MIQGRSGCFIDLIKTLEGFEVLKYTVDDKYASRLVQQARKQIYFSKVIAFHPFSAPQIIQINEEIDGGGASIKMQYVNGEVFTEYLSRCRPSDLNSFCESLIKYLDKGLSRANIHKVDKNLFHSKLYKTLDAIEHIDLNSYELSIIKIVSEQLLTPPSDKILIGYCHGDLTFSNILFEKDTIVFIDFLDSFIETPVHDLVKLRQDTFFNWSLLLINNKQNVDDSRVRLSLKYIDDVLEQWMLKQKGINIWYDYFQKFNLLRILPYTKSLVEQQFIFNSLNKIL